VAGRKRVPSPATGKIALRNGFILALLRQSGAEAPSGGERSLASAARECGLSATGARGLANDPEAASSGPEQEVAGLIDLGGQVAGAAMVGMELDHQAVMGLAECGLAGPGRQPKPLVAPPGGQGRGARPRAAP